MKLRQRRARGPEGYRDYLVNTVTYAKGDVVERFHTGTQYFHKKGYFSAKDSMFTNDVVLTCIKPISWSWTSIDCPRCYDRMCPGHIERGYCSKYRN